MNKTGGLENMVNERNEYDGAKVLVLDIETSPIIAYTWGPKWETNLIECLEHSKVICYSAKWLGGRQVTKGLLDYKGYKKGKIDDNKLVKEVHKLVDEADIVVTQNGVQFDMKVLNARFIQNKLSPPAPYKNVDTKIEAKKYLKLPSYSLDDMGEYFGLGRKMEHEGFELWKKCIAGDTSAWNKMKKYNAQDVNLTEKVYLKILPFMKTHPNMTHYSGKEACPRCDSENTVHRGFYTLTNGKYARMTCNDCGSWYRTGKPLVSFDKKKRSTSI